MPSGEYTKKDSNSVYQKALVICHENQKQLNLTQHELEKDRLQTYIDHKLEAKSLQKELLTLRREQLQLMNEARQNLKERKTIDDIAKETISVQSERNRNLEALKLKKKFSLPHVTPTQRNIPKIMKRSLSYESEFFTWTFGLPQIDGQPTKLKATHERKQQNPSFMNSSASLEPNEKQAGKTFHLPKTEHRICTKKGKTVSKDSKEVRLPAISAASENKVFRHSTEQNHYGEEIQSKSNPKLPPII